MEKKIYNQPTTEVIDVHVENLMLNVSVNGGGGGGSAHAPSRKGKMF